MAPDPPYGQRSLFLKKVKSIETKFSFHNNRLFNVKLQISLNLIWIGH